MRPDDLMKPDLISEVVLLSSGMLIVVTLILRGRCRHATRLAAMSARRHCGGEGLTSLESMPTSGGPDVLPNPIPEADPKPPKPDPTPEPSPVPPIPEPAPAFFGLASRVLACDFLVLQPT
jgi:hypothetical protein